MELDIPKARGFVQSIDLSGTPRSFVGQDAGADAGIV
jgi:hypothetical protein